MNFIQKRLDKVGTILYNERRLKPCAKGAFIMEWKNDIDENVRSGLVELLILQLLTEEDMYGYQIKQELRRRTSETFVMKEGSLYGPLYRMHSRNLISSHREPAGEKRVRNYYHIEPAGVEYLAYGKKEMDRVFRGVKELLNWQKKQQQK